jgi:NAD(P)-dependent dehydrogenase (short-subunit alcohol dehydrogenase family)
VPNSELTRTLTGGLAVLIECGSARLPDILRLIRRDYINFQASTWERLRVSYLKLTPYPKTRSSLVKGISMNSQQKVAIVTGASQGLGAGILQGYRDNGYIVVANSRKIRSSSDEGVIAVPGDISDRDVAQELVETAVQRFGRVDTLINNAGIFIGKPFTEYTTDDFDSMLRVNLGGFFHITQLAIEQMLKQERGHIVQITTTLVEQPISDIPAGLASITKGGLAAVTRGLAIEYAKRGIRVNAVAPGIIKTPMHPAETHEFKGKLHPMGRMGEISDIVKAVMYLESADFVTGETMNVDGGQHAGRW